jgi:hypothetical protein
VRGRIRSIFAIAAVALGMLAPSVPALAQAPGPVPALPDTERRTSYSISASTCSCSVGFALFGDSTDYANWLEVFVNGVLITQSGNWTISSPSGTLGNLSRPITDAVLTFNAPQTGTVQIVGARRPRRVSQYSENQGVPARSLNRDLTDIIAQNRETWDKINDVTGRAVMGRPGETLNLLPILANRINQGACFDSGGSLTSCVSVPSSTFSAGNGITFTGSGPTTIAANLAAGSGILITGTNPLTIAGTYTTPLTGGVARTAVSKWGDVIEASDFGVRCDNSTDDRVNLQAAITAAASIGGTLHISAQNASAVTPYCLVSKNAGGAYALTASNAFHLVCDTGVAIKPTAAVTATTSVLYLFGNPLGANLQTIIEGCFIGDPSVATRNGLHGIVFDTQTAGNLFRAPIVKNVFIQAGTSGNGYGISHINNVTNNPGGGLYDATFGEGSIIQGGVNLNGSGDSITLKGIYPHNGAVGSDDNGILINLISGAGGNAGSTTLDHINLSQAHGVKIDCAYSLLVNGGEYEGQATLTGNALFDVNAGGCTTNSVKIRNAQFQYAPGFGTPLLMRITANASAIVLDGDAFATPTSYTPISNASTTLQLGPNYWNVGAAAHILGTAAANTYGGG